VVEVPIAQGRRLFAYMTDPSVPFPYEGVVYILDPLVAFPLGARSLISSVYLGVFGLIPRLPLTFLLKMRSLIRGRICASLL